ncbi:fibronectin type III domain-containing protein [Ruminococcaceae bacterium OttesenSCG-928-A11]|nr:fibronectin type III domain-containing protein [Ruminococcaceae bacterium OttesenSCG-928-A11]
MPASELPTIEPFVAFWDEGTGSVRLEWMAFLEPATYAVFRSENSSDPASGDFQKIITAAHIADVYHNDRDVRAGVTYHYYVVGVDPTGAYGPAGPVQTVSVPGQVFGGPVTPASSDILPPQNVQATSTQPGLVVLTWDAVPGAMGYVVYRGDHPDGPFGEVAVATNTYTDNTGTEGVTYYYRVASTDRRGTGDYGDACSVTVRSRLAAAVLTATARGTDTIDVNWNRVDEADRYDLYRATEETGTYVHIHTTTDGDVTSYRNTGLAEGTTYWYYVVGRLGAGIGPKSNTDDATTDVTPIAITLTATADGYDAINLNWNGIDNVTNYLIFRSLSPTSGFTYLDSTATGVTTYRNTGLTENTRYYYYVVAYRGSAGNVQSNTADAITDKKPASITLTATAAGYDAINLNWNGIDNVTNYLIFRSLSPTSGFTYLDSTAPGVTTYRNTGLTENTRYYYYIVANRSGESSVQSNTADAITDKKPAVITLTATAAGYDTINLRWNGIDNVTNYYIYRSLSPTTGFAYIGSTATGVTTYRNTGLTENTRYYYYIVANRNGESSVQSNTASAITDKKPTLTLTAKATGYETIALSWNAVSGANRYLVYRSTSATSGFTLVHQLGNVTSKTDTGLKPNTTYYYYVVAYKDATQVVRSNTASAKTPLPGLTVSVSTLSTTSLKVTWTKPVGATSYTIYRSTYNGGYVQIGTKGNENVWTDTGLQPNTVYWYKVVANIGSQGVNSGKTDVVKLSAPLYFKTNINVCKAYYIGLSWMADRSGAVKTYELSYSNTGNANDYRVIGNFSPSSAIYVPVYTKEGYYVQYQHSVVRGRNYYYRVRAQGADGTWSNYAYAGPANTANVVPCYYCSGGISH